MIANFIKTFTFWFYFCIGMVLNICQIAIYFESSHKIGPFIVQLVAAALVFSFWLTSVVVGCYIIGIAVDYLKDKYGEKESKNKSSRRVS